MASGGKQIRRFARDDRGGKRGKRQRSEWRVSGGQPPLSGCRMIDGGQVLCAWPPTGFSHPWIAVFTQLKECPNVD